MTPRKDQGDKLEQASDRDRKAKEPKTKQKSDPRDAPLKDQGDKLDTTAGSGEGH